MIIEPSVCYVMARKTLHTFSLIGELHIWCNIIRLDTYQPQYCRILRPTSNIVFMFYLKYRAILVSVEPNNFFRNVWITYLPVQLRLLLSSS